jgi:hypothetical protein
VLIARRRLGLLAAVGLLVLLLVACVSAQSCEAPFKGALESGPQAQFFHGLNGGGYTAYKYYGVKEGETMVILVGVRVDTDRETRDMYDAIYTHAISSAKQYGVATDEGERLRVELVEATDEQKIIESQDFDLRGGEG